MVEITQNKPGSRGTAIGAAMLFVTSIIFIIGGIKLGLGSPFRLGTGAFPFLTGLILTCLSIAILIQELNSQDDLADAPDWISLLAISAAIAVFAATADRFGLAPAVFLTVIVASFPDRSLSFVGKTKLACAVAATTWILFIELLNLPLKALTGF